ncbi:hypothetical protein P7K49_019306 [Saguinus oedipus]|uniref:Centrosomal protein C10orf90 N-terminal domain-containing protein n=1 Tax=Saguinus oedipus TaxID=9490 RepID=A0ABQ9UY26_SAGOE|nr:hypothetical protein P7K49_019306 [Saguinus oedipus]
MQGLGHPCGLQTSFSPDTPLSGKGPLVFSSCVHLRVSQQCPTFIYYVDKSLSIPFEQPQIASPKMHRSVLSLNLNCSSHRLTAGGVDDIVNGEPISTAPKQKLVEEDQDLLGQRWNPGLQESRLKETSSLGRVNLGTGACPWSDSFPLENTKFADVGTNQVTIRKGIKDNEAHCHASDHANQLSIHIPGWSYRAEDYTCCDLVVKIKECKKSEDPATPEPSPTATSPAPPRKQGALDCLKTVLSLSKCLQDP